MPESVIDRMASELKEREPGVEEGFDSVFTLDEYQNLVKAEVRHGVYY